MRISIEIDERLLRRAMRLTGLGSAQAIVPVALEALVRVLEQERRRRMPHGRRPSVAQLAGRLFGAFPGPADASTNRRYLEEAMLSDAAVKRRRIRRAP